MVQELLCWKFLVEERGLAAVAVGAAATSSARRAGGLVAGGMMEVMAVEWQFSAVRALSWLPDSF